MSGGTEQTRDHQSLVLRIREARYEKMRNVESWMVAAGQVEMMVVCTAEKPKPLTIWLENCVGRKASVGTAKRKEIRARREGESWARGTTCTRTACWLTWEANVDGMVFPLNTSVNVILLYTKFDGEPESPRSHRRDEEHDRLGIPESLPELVPFPMMVPADGLVLRHEEGEEEGEGEGEGAKEDVEELPCGERGVD
jgi:hypothetical protein